MGNCLKSTSEDDNISFLRENIETTPRESIDQNVMQPTYTSQSTQQTSLQHASEEEQIKIAKRIGLIQHLPTSLFDGSKKNRECIICFVEFEIGDNVRYLPCMHFFHQHCIDDWLMRSLTCPECLEPVDSALLTSYENS
ncbi:RING finger protein 11 [Culicoides brevitarsis]|uniref:RING finger protein 11 n=1 Tax=Culicoides brevitarsis TaxID=469753 RepID=UPI00307BDB69